MLVCGNMKSHKFNNLSLSLFSFAVSIYSIYLPICVAVNNTLIITTRVLVTATHIGQNVYYNNPISVHVNVAKQK